MVSALATLLACILALALPRRGASAYHKLGTTRVTVRSNETLRMISEFNYASDYTELKLAARDAKTTVPNLVASQLAMEFEFCFPDEYCPAVTSHTELFLVGFSSNVCKQYCSSNRHRSSLEIVSVCETQHRFYRDSKCIDFGLTVQAPSRPRAEEIVKELGASFAASKPVWRRLLEELAPEFGDGDVGDPVINGYGLSEDRGETWYPAWDRGDERCSNDGKEPFYMKLAPEEYLAPTSVDCCRLHYWWDVQGCAEPEKRPCPEGYVPTPEQIAREGIMTGKYYGRYPNIWYSGCMPSDSGNRKLQHSEEEDEKEARRRELRHREQERRFEALLERQKRLEIFMLPSSRKPPVHVNWKPQRLRS